MIRRACAFLSLLAASSVAAFGAGDAIKETIEPGLYMDPPARGTVAQLAVPLLHSPALEGRWGAPVLTVVEDGSYVLIYRNSKSKDTDEFLKIVGTRRPLSVLKGYSASPKREGTATVLGQRVDYSINGNESPAWQSIAFALTAPDGRAGNYVLFYGGRRPWPGSFFPPVTWAAAKSKRGL